MLFSLLTYFLLALSLYVLAKDEEYYSSLSTEKNCNSLRWQAVAGVLIFAAFYGARYNVGVDNLTYIKNYESLKDVGFSIRKSFEIGYNAVACFSANLKLHYSVFIGFWGLLQISFVYYAVRNDKHLLPYIALFIVLGPIFLTWANLMRQCVVECMFIYLISTNCRSNNILLYSFWVLVGTLIHKSAFFLFPLYFLIRNPIFPKSKWILCGGLLLCTLIGATPTWINNLSEYIGGTLAFLHYDDYTLNLESIIENANKSRAWGPARLGTWLLYLISMWFYPQIRDKYDISKRFDAYFVCFYYGVCVYELFANTSQIFIRPIGYLRDCSVIVIPLCLYYLKKEERMNLFYLLCGLAYFYSFYWTLKAFNGGGGTNAPEVYKFFFTI